jgi:phage baseplate assembly protein W
MFPFDMDDDEDVVVDEDSVPSDYEIDFSKGKLTGRIITGLDAIIQWARIVLSTDRYYYTQYSWDHGSELQELIGKSMSKEYATSEIKRMITDALMVNDDVLGIDDLEYEITNDRITASFTINTVYGGGEVYV